MAGEERESGIFPAYLCLSLHTRISSQQISSSSAIFPHLTIDLSVYLSIYRYLPLFH